MSHFESRSLSSRSTMSAVPSSSTRNKDTGFVAPNSRRGGRDFKVVRKHKSGASISDDKKDASGRRGFRKALGQLIAGRSSARPVEVEMERPSAETPRPRPRLVNPTSEWVQREANRAQLRERELRRHEAAYLGSDVSVDPLDDESVYAFDVGPESDGFPAPPRRHYALANTSLSTFPNLSQLSLHDTYVEPTVRTNPSSRNSTLPPPIACDPASRRLSSRSSPQLRPVFLPSTLPMDPLPPVPAQSSSTKVAPFSDVSLPATPPASPPIEASTFTESLRTGVPPSSPGSSESDSLLAPSPSVQRRASYRHSFLAPSNSLGLAMTTSAPLVTSSVPVARASPVQKKLDTTTRMLRKALSFELVYLAKVSIPRAAAAVSASGSIRSSVSLAPLVATLEVVSSSGMPRPEPEFDPELHLAAVRSSTGVLFHSPDTSSSTHDDDREAFKTGLLVPVLSTSKVGYVLCALTRSDSREVGERELRWVAKFAEELEEVVIRLGVRP